MWERDGTNKREDPMRGALHIVVSFITVSCATAANAYTVSTHMELSRIAVENSMLKRDPALLSDLGLGAYGTPEFVDTDGKVGNVTEIIAFGAQFEDDDTTGRFLRHFYDPQFNNYAGRGLAGFSTSPDWALEDRGPIALQDYSYEDARDAYLQALSCRTAPCRRDAFSLVFQTMGHVIHHIQDMGQPQHTRNDIHPIEPRNFYEKYTEGNNARIRDIIDANAYGDFPFAQYCPLPRNYWETLDGSSHYKGMAEFTGLNFVSMNSMYQISTSSSTGFTNHSEFPEPSGNNLQVITEKRTWVTETGAQVSGDIDLIKASVRDDLKPSRNTTHGEAIVAAMSIFDPHMGSRVPPMKILSVNSIVAESRYPILLPRIAAFSTDLIDYFFRGRIDMVKNPSGAGWLIQNRSSELMSGNFVLYYDNSLSERTKLTEWPLTVPSGGEAAPVSFTPPSFPVKNYVLVFVGTLGMETAAVAGKVLDISPITPIPCGKPINAGGGTDGYSQTHALGTEAGVVELDFEAYSIPDEIRVTARNESNKELVNSKGQVSGFNIYKFTYDPNSLGTTNVKVKVTGNKNTGTSWTFTLGCPGQNLGNSDRVAKRVGVSFKYGISAGGNSNVTCNSDVSVDGKRIGRVVGLGTTIPVTLTEGDSHRVNYSNTSCEGGSSFNNGYPATFTDSKGNAVNIPSPRFDANANFSINVR